MLARARCASRLGVVSRTVTEAYLARRGPLCVWLGRTVLDEPLGAGTREVRLDTRRLASGVYAVVLEAGTSRASRTVTVVR